jgi:hypothetical protein
MRTSARQSLRPRPAKWFKEALFFEFQPSIRYLKMHCCPGPKARSHKSPWQRPEYKLVTGKALKEGVTNGCMTLQSKRSSTRSRGEESTAVTASFSGILCVPAPLRDTLFHKDLCRAEARRRRESHCAPLAKTAQPHGNMQNPILLAPRNSIAATYKKTFVTPSEGATHILRPHYWLNRSNSPRT